MMGVMKRRELILGTLAAGAALSVPGRALARAAQDAPLGQEFDQAFGLVTAPQVPTAAPSGLPLAAPPNPGYDARLIEIAKRELERAGAAVWRSDIVGIADFARASTLPRFHFVNLEMARSGRSVFHMDADRTLHTQAFFSTFPACLVRKRLRAEPI